jgi:hypothetical protein
MFLAEIMAEKSFRQSASSAAGDQANLRPARALRRVSPMPKFPEPFFRTAWKAWFVQVAGKQVNLGPDREALRRYHQSYLPSAGKPTAAP